MAGICANDFLNVLACRLEWWREREGSACIFFGGCEWGRQEEGAASVSDFWLAVLEMESWLLNFFSWSGKRFILLV